MNNPLFNLENKVALVSGGYRGLGYSMARGLAECGAIVGLNGRSAEGVSESVAELEKAGFNAFSAVFDITDEQAVKEGIARITKEYGNVDILVNNAGIHDRAPLAEMQVEQFENVLNTNLKSAFMLSREVIGGMREKGGGKIINICSLMSKLARPTTGNYSAAKGGLAMLTRSMCAEWAAWNVQINAIGPGYFKTELTKPLYTDESFDAWIRGRTPSARWGDPQDLKGVVAFLAAPASAYINGQIIYVDGGLSSVI